MEPEKPKTSIERAMEKAADEKKKKKSVDNPPVDKMQRSPVIKK